MCGSGPTCLEVVGNVRFTDSFGKLQGVIFAVDQDVEMKLIRNLVRGASSRDILKLVDGGLRSSSNFFKTLSSLIILTAKLSREDTGSGAGLLLEADKNSIHFSLSSVITLLVIVLQTDSCWIVQKPLKVVFVLSLVYKLLMKLPSKSDVAPSFIYLYLLIIIIINLNKGIRMD